MSIAQCGTAGCALGWGTAVPCLKKAGLYLKTNGYGTLVKLKGRRALKIAAGAKVFGITNGQSQWLFSPSTYYKGSRTKVREVIIRIRKLAK